MPEAVRTWIEPEPFFCYNNTSSPRPWSPDVETITYSYFDTVPHPQVDEIIKAAADAWNSRLADTRAPKLVKVNSGGIVRIGFRTAANAPGLVPYINYALIGTDNSASYAKDKPCMSIIIGSNASEPRRKVYSVDYLFRAACHHFGHVLGLPHARRPNDFPGWNSSSAFDNTAYNVVPWEMDMATVRNFPYLTGLSTLDSAQSIMHIDLPGPFSASGKHFRCGGSTIDQQAVTAVRQLYPYFAFSRQIRWFGDWPTQAGDRVHHETVQPGWDLWVMAGMTHVDFGLRGNFRIDVDPYSNGSNSYYMRARTWGDTDIFGVQVQYLAIPRTKTDVAGGHIAFGSFDNRVEQTVYFSRPFAKPVVVVTLCRLDSDKNTYVRYRCGASAVSSTSAKIYVETWLGTRAYGVGVTWLVHEADDPAIRSGCFSDADQKIKSNAPPITSWGEKVVPFSKPLSFRPRALFYGFNYMDVPSAANIRIKADASFRDESSIKATVSTWVNQSAFYGLDCAYIAIM